MYENALLTAGAEKVQQWMLYHQSLLAGHSALTGIYKAYDVEGEELDKERMELSQ